MSKNGVAHHFLIPKATIYRIIARCKNGRSIMECKSQIMTKRKPEKLEKMLNGNDRLLQSKETLKFGCTRRCISKTFMEKTKIKCYKK